MKFSMTRYTISNNLETTGDDIIFINAFVHTGNKIPLAFPVSIPYDSLVDFIVEIEPEVGNYLKNIRYGMNGYGPKHSKVFEVLRNEEFDLDKYIHLYIENKDEAYVEMHTEWVNRVLSLPQDKKTALNESVQNLNNSLPTSFSKSNINFDNFLDEFDQTVHELTLKLFPELFEKGEEYIYMYRKLLCSTTLSFCRTLDSINHGKFYPHWEEEYALNKKKDGK